MKRLHVRVKSDYGYLPPLSFYEVEAADGRYVLAEKAKAEVDEARSAQIDVFAKLRYWQDRADKAEREVARLRKIESYRAEDKRAFDALQVARNLWQARAEKADADAARMREETLSMIEEAESYVGIGMDTGNESEKLMQACASARAIIAGKEHKQ